MVNPNNNPSEVDKSRRIFELYPDGKTSLPYLYDDDGTTQKYLNGEGATTLITSDLNDKKVLTVSIDKPWEHSMEWSKISRQLSI